MADWVEQINDYIREKGKGDAHEALKTALVYISAQHIVMNDNVLEIQRLQKKILGIEFPNVMQSVNGLWGADIEYNYLCPFCGAKAHTLDNLKYCHFADCIWDELTGENDNVDTMGVCGFCGSDIGHRINCPNGIAFSHAQEGDGDE